MSRYVRALFTSHITPTVQIIEGEIWAADDPFVLTHPDFFSADLETIARRTGPRPETTPEDPPRRGPGRPRKIETTDNEHNFEVTA